MSSPNANTTDSPGDSYYFCAPHLGDLNFQGPYHPTMYENLYSDTNPGPRYLRIFKTVNGVTEVLPNNEWVYPFDNGTNNPTSSPTLVATATSILPVGLAAPIPTHTASVPFAAPSQGPTMVAESLNPSVPATGPHTFIPRPSNIYQRPPHQGPWRNAARTAEICQTIANRRQEIARAEMQRQRDVANIVNNAVREYIESGGILEGFRDRDEDGDEEIKEAEKEGEKENDKEDEDEVCVLWERRGILWKEERDEAGKVVISLED